MSKKSLVSIGMIAGSIIGGYVPAIFGISLFSFASILMSGIGAILGVWIGYKLGED